MNIELYQDLSSLRAVGISAFGSAKYLEHKYREMDEEMLTLEVFKCFIKPAWGNLITEDYKWFREVLALIKEVQE